MPTTFYKNEFVSTDYSYSNTSYSGADMLATVTIRDTKTLRNVTCTLGDLQTLSYSTHMGRGAVRKLGDVNSADFTNGPRTIAGSLVFAVFNKHMIQPFLEEMGISHQLLPDELPPFDITVTFANEYGHNSVLRIYGVRLVNEGEVLSTSDVFIENTYQYVAKNIDLLKDMNASKTATEINEMATLPLLSNQEDAPQVEDFIEDAASYDLGFDSDFRPEDIEAISTLLIIENQDNNIIFDVDYSQDDLIVDIKGSSEVTYNIASNQWPFSAEFKTGTYYATLRKADGKIYNTINFTVAPLVPNAPYVTKVTETMLMGGVIDNNIEMIICIDSEGNSQSVIVQDCRFAITDLKPNESYLLVAINDVSVKSSAITAQTLLRSQDIFSGFRDFIEQTTANQPAIATVIKEAEQSGKNFIPAIVAAHKKSDLDETFLHLANYYYLMICEKNTHFIMDNKWLCLISPNKDASYFRVQTTSGVSQQINHAQGEVVISQDYQNITETLELYRCTPSLQMKYNTAYLKSIELYTSYKEAYDSRYGSIIDINDCSYYDYELKSNGAYIEILENNQLQARGQVGNSARFVFVDDLFAGAHISVTAESPLTYETLPFFNEHKRYNVYLEVDGAPASKLITIVDGKASYCYSTLLIHAYQHKILDFIQQLTVEELDAFQTFCFGFYLLASKNQVIKDYITVFDKWLYSTKAKNELKIKIQTDIILFEEEADYHLFDSKGNYLLSGRANQVPLPTEGYIIWGTANHVMDFLKF